MTSLPSAKVLVTHPRSRLATYFGEQALSDLRQIADVRLNNSDDDLSGAALADAARDCAVIIAYRQTPVDAAVLKTLPTVQAIVRCAVDIRTIDVAAASAQGILVTQASAGFMASVSEWIIGAMIDMSRHISAGVMEYRAHGFARPRMGRELRGATLGVIGFGQIARHLCILAKALGMRVLVTDPYATVDVPGMAQTSLPELLAGSDYVVCLAPANAQTENMMNAQAFASMRAGSYFINAARGDLVDDAALLQALDSGHLAGAALDVGRAPDQMPMAELARHDKVIASPHIGGLTPPAIEHQALETVRQTAEILQGRIPVGAVNADDAARLRQSASTPATP
jgi:D-3-phosphoglycerate dehydrogenase